MPAAHKLTDSKLSKVAKTSAVGVEFGTTLKHGPTSNGELKRPAERRGDVSDVHTPVWSSYCYNNNMQTTNMTNTL